MILKLLFKLVPFFGNTLFLMTHQYFVQTFGVHKLTSSIYYELIFTPFSFFSYYYSCFKSNMLPVYEKIVCNNVSTGPANIDNTFP